LVHPLSIVGLDHLFSSHGDQTRLNELEKECGQLREKVKSLEMQLSKHDESSNDGKCAGSWLIHIHLNGSFFSGRKKSSEIQLAQSNKVLNSEGSVTICIFSLPGGSSYYTFTG
jgi:hypothetical protein